MNAGYTQAQNTISIRTTDRGKMYQPDDKSKQVRLMRSKEKQLAWLDETYARMI